MNNAKKYFSGIIFLLQILFCSTRYMSGTESDTGSIVGWVIDKSQKPINNATVLLHNPGFSTDTARTDVTGRFEFMSVDTGDYYLEINSHDTMGALVETSVMKNGLNVELDSIVPKKYGTIRGSLDVSLRGDFATSIYIIALDRMIPVDSGGQFLINNIPESDYSFRLVMDNITVKSPIDTLHLSVTEQDTTEAYNIGVVSGDISIDGVIHE